jgi:hypothetical protein
MLWYREANTAMNLGRAQDLHLLPPKPKGMHVNVRVTIPNQLGVPYNTHVMENNFDDGCAISRLALASGYPAYGQSRRSTERCSVTMGTVQGLSPECKSERQAGLDVISITQRYVHSQADRLNESSQKR